MGRSFVYVILGGGVAAGYAALEFSRRGISPGELCIISEENVAPYERPTLSKGFLQPEAPVRLPAFYTCVGANEERLTPEWYKDHGIELIFGTRVKYADMKRKTLTTEAGETIDYKFLIIATGARALKLEEFGVKGSDAENICYLRSLADATKLVDIMKSCVGGKAVVVGGGYIGLECAAALVTNKIKVTMVFPAAHLMDRLFTPKIANFYEDYYKSKGVNFIKGTVVSSFEKNSKGKVTAAILKDGTRVPADMAVVGVGARANTSLFEGQLKIEKGGIKVDGKMQTIENSVYAVGDVAVFPIKLFGGDTHRFEHVDSARKTGKHAVSAIMSPKTTGDIDYLPFFYSRVFTLSWQFYGDNKGEVIHFGDFSLGKFGAYWVDNGRIVGAFLESGSKEENEAIAKVVRLKPRVRDVARLEILGLEFAMWFSRRMFPGRGLALSGAVVAVLIAAIAYWFRYKFT